MSRFEIPDMERYEKNRKIAAKKAEDSIKKITDILSDIDHPIYEKQLMGDVIGNEDSMGHCDEFFDFGLIMEIAYGHKIHSQLNVHLDAMFEFLEDNKYDRSNPFDIHNDEAYYIPMKKYSKAFDRRRVMVFGNTTFTPRCGDTFMLVDDQNCISRKVHIRKIAERESGGSGDYGRRPSINTYKKIGFDLDKGVDKGIYGDTRDKGYVMTYEAYVRYNDEDSDEESITDWQDYTIGHSQKVDGALMFAGKMAHPLQLLQFFIERIPGIVLDE